MATKQFTFDSYPYLLTHAGEDTDLIRLFPKGHSEDTLRFCAGCQRNADGREATLVLGPGESLQVGPEGVIPSSAEVARKEHLLVGPEGCDLEFTETAELFSRYRYLRTWYAFEYGRALPTGDGNDRARISFREYSGTSRALQELSAANEVVDFLVNVRALRGESAWDADEDSLRAFLRVASWHDTLQDLWDSGLRQEWTLWLAANAVELGLLPQDVASEITTILESGNNGARAAKLLDRFPALFNRSGSGAEAASSA